MCGYYKATSKDPRGTHLWVEWGGPSLQNFDRHLKAQHELVPLKETKAGVAVHITRQGVSDGSQTPFKVDLTFAGCQGLQACRFSKKIQECSATGPSLDRAITRPGNALHAQHTPCTALSRGLVQALLMLCHIKQCCAHSVSG